MLSSACTGLPRSVTNTGLDFAALFVRAAFWLTSRLVMVVMVVMVMAGARCQPVAVGQVQLCGVGGSGSGRRAVG